VRRFVEETFERLVGDAESVFRVSMTAHELLENAAKYSLGQKTLLRVSLEEVTEGHRLSLCLINDTTGAHMDRLRDRIDELNATTDAFELYQSLMRKNMKNRDESGLGLARICAEGEMSLGLEIKGNTVAIMTSALFPKKGPV
jgi:hypothetical protein